MLLKVNKERSLRPRGLHRLFNLLKSANNFEFQNQPTAVRCFEINFRWVEVNFFFSFVKTLCKTLKISSSAPTFQKEIFSLQTIFSLHFVIFKIFFYIKNKPITLEILSSSIFFIFRKDLLELDFLILSKEISKLFHPYCLKKRKELMSLNQNIFYPYGHSVKN